MTLTDSATSTLPRLDVRISPLSGRGVYAAEDIPAGATILSDHVFLIRGKDIDAIDETGFGRYVFEWDDESTAVVFGLGSLINHGSPSNVELETNEQELTMRFSAARDIAAGEELIYDYGHEDVELREYYGIPV